MRRVFLAFVVVSALVGCAATTTAYKRDSAHAIQPTPDPDSVQISDLRHGLGWSKWVATTRRGVYDCSLESGERYPLCVKREPPP
jgi:hypothetical protein